MPIAPGAERDYLPGVECPNCAYALEGLPRTTPACPECGCELSAAAFAKAAARRMSRNRAARLALLASPAVAVFCGAVAFAVHRGSYAAVAFQLGCLWIGAGVAVYHSKGRSRARRLGMALLVGLPLGVVYFVAVAAATVGVTRLIAWLVK